MLEQLQIRNVAVVDDTVIEFAEGLNVLTGATGAGKSIMLTAVELLSGSRANRALLRRGTDRLVIEGIFSVPEHSALRERLGMEQNEEALSIRREVSSDGRSRLWINGMASSNAAARDHASILFELHGQHGQQEILDPANHVRFLDARGDYRELLKKATTGIKRYEEYRERLRRLQDKAEEHRNQEDFLRFQMKEIESLELEPDLDRKLEARISMQANIHRYLSALHESRELLNGGNGSILERLTKVEDAFGSLNTIDTSWEEAASEIGSIRISLQEIAREIERSLSDATDHPENLEILQERLAAVQRSCRKFHLDVSGLIEKREQLRGIIRSLENGSGEILEASSMVRSAGEELIPLLEHLSDRRRSIAKILDREITDELQKLGMKGAYFHTHIEKLENSAFEKDYGAIHLTENGWDVVEFRIRTNVGEEMHPIGEIASGGELSRITLVLKKLQAEGRGIPTLVFDEVDTGLGADLGGVVAERLSALARRYQIICITHLPQIAACADQHIHVRKRVTGGRTVTTAEVLAGDERIREIARMLGGRGKLREALATELLRGKTCARSSVG